MRILFLTHYFPPEVNAPANRTFDHCRLWAEAGHEVHVVTCVPSHPRGVPFTGYRRRWYQAEQMEGIRVHRVWTHLAPNSGVARRTINYLSFLPSAVWRALRLGPVDVIVATSPQFFCAVAGHVAAMLKGTPWVFELRDLWPESIAAVGAVRASLALRLLERLELRMYRHAALVACVTHSFVENLTRRGIDSAKIAFIPNGIDPEYWSTGDGSRLRREHGVGHDELLVSYVGTIGMAHGLATVLDTAAELQDRLPKTRFFVVGDGAELSAIRETAAARRLSNVTFTGLVPRDEARDYLAASDISLVTLKKSPLFKTVLPSKMFEAMGAGKPVVLGVEGEASEVLQRAQAGLVVEPENAASMSAAIGRLSRDPHLRARLGQAGRAFVAREFSRTRWAAEFERLLQTAATRADA